MCIGLLTSLIVFLNLQEIKNFFKFFTFNETALSKKIKIKELALPKKEPANSPLQKDLISEEKW
jgi:hypothetical protein